MGLNLDEGLIRSIREIGQNYGIERIVLFGSRARGDHKPGSDIDLAVFLMSDFNGRGHLTSDFDELNMLLKIDVIFINKDLDLKLLENIEKEGVVLYERANHKTS